MSRSVVYALDLQRLIAHARHPAGEQRLAHGISTEHPMTPGPDNEPGPVSHHPGPDFIPRELEARA